MSNGAILPLVVFVCLFYIILHLNKKVEEWRDESIRLRNEIGDIIALIKRNGMSDEIFDRDVFKIESQDKLNIKKEKKMIVRGINICDRSQVAKRACEKAILKSMDNGCIDKLGDGTETYLVIAENKTQLDMLENKSHLFEELCNKYGYTMIVMNK